VAGSVAVGMPLPGVLGGLWDAFRGLTDGDVTKEDVGGRLLVLLGVLQELGADDLHQRRPGIVVALVIAVGMPLPGVLGGLWDAFRGLTDGDVTKEDVDAVAMAVAGRQRSRSSMSTTSVTPSSSRVASKWSRTIA
jgi:hypothetical protein